MLHTKRLGTQGELIVCEDLLRRGFDIYTSIGDYSKIDIIAIKDDQIVRLQVKSVVDSSTGVFSVSASKIANKGRVFYAENDFDYLAACLLDKKIVAYIPLSLLTPRKGQSISIRFEQNKSRNKNSNLFENFQTICPRMPPHF